MDLRLYLSYLLCTVQYSPMILFQVESDKRVEYYVKMGRESKKSQAMQMSGTETIWLEFGKNNFSPYHLFPTQSTALIGRKTQGSIKCRPDDQRDLSL